MKIDPTFTIPSILAICAIISPILVALINNCHQTKIKKIELKQQEITNTLIHKRSILEEYLSTAGRCVHYNTEEALNKYGEIYAVALMFAPEYIQHEMKILDNLIRQCEYQEASKQLFQLAPRIYPVAQWQCTLPKRRLRK